MTKRIVRKDQIWELLYSNGSVGTFKIVGKPCLDKPLHDSAMACEALDVHVDNNGIIAEVGEYYAKYLVTNDFELVVDSDGEILWEGNVLYAQETTRH